MPHYKYSCAPTCFLPLLSTAKSTVNVHLYIHISVSIDFRCTMTKEVSEHGSFGAKDYHDPPPAPLIDAEELTKWSFYRALIAEFIATLLFLYVTVLTVIGYKSQSAADECGGVGILGIAWAFGGMIFILVYCTAGISGSDALISQILELNFTFQNF